MQGLEDLSREELIARLRSAEEAVAARDDFLATAAHELRSPLNALALRLAALEKLAVSTGQDELGRHIARTRQTVDRYVRRAIVLLDVSRLNSRQLQLAPSPVRVSDLVRQVVEDYRDEAGFRGASLESEVEGDAVGEWDAHMVEQVLGNLVSNALRYGEGSPVRVRAFVREPGWAAFEVEDQGPGIAQEQRARIFEKFERVATGSREQSGFGLGLWLVGRIVAAHGGTIDVVAPPQGGTLFRVRLPLAPAASTPEEVSE